LSRFLHSRPAPISSCNTIPTQLVHVSANAKFRFSSLEQPQALPDVYAIQRHDVICWPKGVRSCDTPWNPGNERFRIIVQMRVERYRQASSRLAKMNLCKEGVEAVRDAGGRFVRRVCRHATTVKELDDSSDIALESSTYSWQWVDIGNKRAREKVGHALRQEVLKQSNRPIEFLTTRPSKKRCSFSDSSWSTEATGTSTSNGGDSCCSASSSSRMQQDSPLVDESPLVCNALGSAKVVPEEDDGLLLLANRVWSPFEFEP
jgi:hypothetical protein